MNKRHCWRRRYKSHSHCPSIHPVCSFRICYLRHHAIFADLSKLVINCQTELYHKITDCNLDVGYFTRHRTSLKKFRSLERSPRFLLLSDFSLPDLTSHNDAAYRDVARPHIVSRSERAGKERNMERNAKKKRQRNERK